MTLLWHWAIETKLLQSGSKADAEWPGFFAADDMPDVVFFADTQREPKAVYVAVEEARALCESVGIPFEILTVGDLGRPVPAKTGTQGVFTPVFTIATEAREHIDWIDSAHGTFDTEDEAREHGVAPIHRRVKQTSIGDVGQLWRQCTGRYKIEPMVKRAKELAQGRPLEIWLGFSSDEISRLKPSHDPTISYRYPLIMQGYMDALADVERLGLARMGPMNRNDCITYLQAMEAPRAKSACSFCPYRRDVAWAHMQAQDPDAFEDACQYDEWVRDKRPGYLCYVHESRTPLRQRVFQGDGQSARNDTRTANLGVIDLGIFAQADMSQSGGCEEGYCGF